MGFVYHKLTDQKRRRKGSGLPSRAFVIVKRVAVKVVGIICSGRRRRHQKKVTLAGSLWARLRKIVRLPPPSGGRRKVPAAVYDLESYARNFDDGAWKEEEEEYWRSGSFAYRFGHPVRLITT